MSASKLTAGRFRRRLIDGEVPGDRVQPSAELVPAVILMTAFQYPHPCFLEQVFGDGTICRQAHKVTQQPMLVLLDETVQQVRVSPAKATNDSAGLGLHPVHEVAGGRVHANGYTGEHLEKMHCAVLLKLFMPVPRRSIRAGGIAMKTS